jgi:hypothetical protein
MLTDEQIEDIRQNFPALPKMDLRDYFAAKAMQALVSSSAEDWLEADIWAPEKSYEIADAMLKARNK